MSREPGNGRITRPCRFWRKSQGGAVVNVKRSQVSVREGGEVVSSDGQGVVFDFRRDREERKAIHEGVMSIAEEQLVPHLPVLHGCRGRHGGAHFHGRGAGRLPQGRPADRRPGCNARRRAPIPRRRRSSWRMPRRFAGPAGSARSVSPACAQSWSGRSSG
jgi:hypothetical protein